MSEVPDWLELPDWLVVYWIAFLVVIAALATYGLWLDVKIARLKKQLRERGEEP